MTTKEKIQAAIDRVDAILRLDFITTPVREELNLTKAQLETAVSELG
tara:strand:+ start:319 stop:459 length:141 start_codon:yes stop_codon:yes gene_type:complete